MANAEQASGQNSENLQRHYEDFESRRQFLLLYLFHGIAGAFLFSFGISAIYAGRTGLAMVTLFFGTVTVINISLLKFTGKQHFARAGFVFGVLVLFAYHLVTGGVSNTGPLWCYPSLAAIFFIQGTRRGLPLAAVMFVIAIVVFYVSVPGIEFAAYTSDFKLRFISTYCMLGIFVALHEYARARNQEELYRVSGQLDQLSHTDQLTALPNRRYMIDRLEAENSRYIRYGRPYSILYGDIDDFKEVNDHCGHQTGDLVLQTIAQKIRTTVRQHDEICRWGGEEFLIMLPETDQQLATEVAEKLRATIEATEFKHGDSPLQLTMSFGVHTVDCAGNVDAFIHLADKKLYQAKYAGKNCVVTDLSEMNSQKRYQ